MYQLEVKRWLVEHRFLPRDGWKVRVDIDAMERANGGQHKEDKAARARIAEDALLSLGATIGSHPEFGRADIVADHPAKGLFIVEVEGFSRRQTEQAIYSALGQLLLQMHGRHHNFVLAVPDDPTWERGIRRIPSHPREVLGLTCLLVSPSGIREL